MSPGIAELIAERIDARAPAIDGLLAIRGVIDVVEAEESEEDPGGGETGKDETP